MKLSWLLALPLAVSAFAASERPLFVFGDQKAVQQALRGEAGKGQLTFQAPKPQENLVVLSEERPCAIPLDRVKVAREIDPKMILRAKPGVEQSKMPQVQVPAPSCTE